MTRERALEASVREQVDMSILQVYEGDIPNLQNIAERCLTESILLEDSVLRELKIHTAKNIRDYAVKDRCVFVKYVEEKQVVGYILIKNFWNLSDLFVMPEKQGRGIGAKLLKYAIASAREKSDRNYIWVNSSENAEQFYRKCGFNSRVETGKCIPGVVPLELLL